MELDKRIEDIKDIKTIITADENDVGKMGYFANSVDYFKDLKKLNGLKYGKLLFFFYLLILINLMRVLYVTITGHIIISFQKIL